MYWIYLIIFVAVVFTPELIDSDNAFLRESSFESLIIFCLGILGLIIYLAKEKALLAMIKEKIFLQKQTNIITRDLSNTYSYIGEMNRKFDIVKNLAFHLPRALTESDSKESGLYDSILEAVCLLTKVEDVSLRFVQVKGRLLDQVAEKGSSKKFTSFDARALLKEKKMFWESSNCLIARSPREACGVLAFLVFPKKVNVVEDAEIFKILASEALFLYCGQKRILQEREKKTPQPDKG